MSRRRAKKPGRIRSAIANWLSPIASYAFGSIGGYNATDPRRKGTISRIAAHKATANQLLNGSGPALRQYCRALERNNPSARAGIEALTAIIVGTGISLEPDTGDEALDAQIRDRFNDIVERIGVHGESVYQLQGLGIRDMVTCGEGVWRIVPSDDPRLPFRVLPLDSEWLADDVGDSEKDRERQLTIAAGVGLDKYGRPVRYYLRNPETDGDVEPVSSRDIVHFFERRRPIQHRGEPWFAPVIETLMQERDLVDAELEAAVNTAALGIVIESDMPDEGADVEAASGDDPAQAVALRSVVRLFPGEKVHAFSHQRPSQQIAPFRQMLRGDIAASLRIPQRFLDRDVSRANYSSMRADMIDTERLLAPVREWFGKMTIGAIYELVAPLIAAEFGIPMFRTRYRLVPDEQPYIDPQKDVAAATSAINGDLSTLEHEIGKRGGDWKQVEEQRQRERIDIALARIEEIKRIDQAVQASGVDGLEWSHIATLSGAATAPGAYLSAAGTTGSKDDQTDTGHDDEPGDDQ